MTQISGGCFCGAIQFQIDPPTKFLANCHCSECRRSNGAAFVSWLGVKESQFKITKGQNHLGRYEYPAETKEASREFCKVCGSPLFFRGARWPGEIHITRACINGSVDRELQAEVFFSDKAEWYDPEKKLTRLGGKSGVEKL